MRQALWSVWMVMVVPKTRKQYRQFLLLPQLAAASELLINPHVKGRFTNLERELVIDMGVRHFG